MRKALIGLQDLRRKLYVKAKAEPSWRFWGMYDHVCKMETLQAAYAVAKSNDGAPGIDGIQDDDVMALLKKILKSSGSVGVPQGGIISPVLSNLYLNEVDRMLEKLGEVTRRGRYQYVEYARFADDRVVLVDRQYGPPGLLGQVNRRLREEFAISSDGFQSAWVRQ